MKNFIIGSILVAFLGVGSASVAMNAFDGSENASTYVEKDKGKKKKKCNPKKCKKEDCCKKTSAAEGAEKKSCGTTEKKSCCSKEKTS
ncbi:MAG: hypothetical protein EAZ57_02350 [Cytophagales bacterium]|nr:MAG: hypothetical protein EAZ67_02235 [Cytophagales bacterium]TAF61958.1 MAG: hypothetical protein EAZ57_02350 [Cytophagales bacterium]